AQATLMLPNGISGNFQVFVAADATNAVSERAFEGNNVGRTVEAIAITLKPAPDLQVSDLTVPPSGEPGDASRVSWTVSNAGAGAAIGAWEDQVYLSLDGSLTGATFLKAVQHTSALAAG